MKFNFNKITTNVLLAIAIIVMFALIAAIIFLIVCLLLQQVL